MTCRRPPGPTSVCGAGKRLAYSVASDFHSNLSCAWSAACSTGLYARALARAAPGAVVAGIDHSWAMLREARRRALQRGLPISFVRAIAQALPLRSASVAGYTMGGSLNE